MPKELSSTKKVKKAVKPVVKAGMTRAAKITKTPVASAQSLSLGVHGADGSVSSKVSLPAELFNAEVHTKLLAQAVRIYLANQRVGGASTKTRGEVEGSTRKIYRQKGTGKARHGSIRAPIFVGGGIVFGPQPQDHRLDFPKKMRRVALASALSYQFKEGNVFVMDDMSTVDAKTKSMMNVLSANKFDSDKLLVILPKEADNVRRALRNVDGVTLRLADNVNVYEVLWHKTIVFSKTALPLLKETYIS